MGLGSVTKKTQNSVRIHVHVEGEHGRGGGGVFQYLDTYDLDQ